ncbi:MAG: prephenate dehydratase [Anaerolineales bacterium]
MSETIVAFQGEHGAFSEEAIRQHFGESVCTLPCESFEAIFEAIRTEAAHYGMLPVENALAGTVAQTYELLMEYDFRVQGETILPIHHQLLGAPGTTTADIQVVRSHPQALAQCEAFLRRRGWQPQAAYDTAGAARDLAAHPEAHTATIASRLAAELYNLNILERDIEDDLYNSTRFFILGKDDAPRQDPSKTSLVFAVRHSPGSLYHCIGAFARREINLTKLESRSMKGRLWQYLFYLDLEGHWQDPNIELALAELLHHAAFVKMLGSYPAAKGGPNSR